MQINFKPCSIKKKNLGFYETNEENQMCESFYVWPQPNWVLFWICDIYIKTDATLTIDIDYWIVYIKDFYMKEDNIGILHS